MHRLALALFAVSASLAFPTVTRADIVLNEMLPNPAGDDVGTERVEIYNNGATTIDVTGWAIDDAATIDEVGVRARLPEDFDISVCSASALIGPGERRVVKGQTTAAWLNNGGDDVYLVTSRVVSPVVVDAVTYPSASAQVDISWACVPDGSENFDWRPKTFCGSNGGAGDVTPPTAIANLSAAAGSFPGEVLLSWTATGDDGASGTASEYSFKVSNVPITPANFDLVADLTFWVDEPVPAPSGSGETLLVAGMNTASTFFFAVKAIDDASNLSGISNCPSTTPAAGQLLSTDFGLSTYFGNLHSHTAYSDGEQTPADAYAYARFDAITPLDFLAVTDHNHSGAGMLLPNYALGMAQANAATVDGSFVALYGQEFGLSGGGHAIVLESPALFGWDSGNYDVFVAEGDYAGLYTAAKQNPPAAGPPSILWAHPDPSHYNNLEDSTDSDVVNLICLVNGPAFSESETESDVGNTGFDDTYREALRKGHRVSPTADQDNHNANWGASTQSRTAVLAPALTENAILTALADGFNYATQDHNAVVGFSAEGRKMGEEFSQATGIRIAVEVDDPDPSDTIELIEVYRGFTGLSNAVRVAYNVGNTRLDWRDTTEFAEGTEVHYYVRIRQGDAQQIWTAPAYVTYEEVTAVAQSALRLRLDLSPIWPNPARADAFVRFVLPAPGDAVTLDVLDVSGRLVRQMAHARLAAGPHQYVWDGRRDSGLSAAPGIYLVRLGSTRFGAATQKVIRIR